MLISLIAAIGFLTPWLAWGALAAVGLPVLAHLLSKTRYREVAFPAARLVQQAVAATSRIETPRHRLLMLLRWLVLMLLVLAFMRPQWTPDALADSPSERGVALVLLIDASASMQRTEGGVSLYDRAKRRAQQLIDQLDPTRDVAAVIRVDHAPGSLLPEATAQFSLLAERLDATEPGYTHANWPDAIATMQRLSRDEPRTLRLITLSDQQGERPDAALEHLPITGPTDNTAIRLVDVWPYPAIANQPINAVVEVRHFGDELATATLSAEPGGQRIERSLALAPGETRRVGLRLPGVVGEREALEIKLNTPDALEADNIAGIWLPVQTSPRALIVHDASAASASIATELATLLNPGDVAGLTLPEVTTVAIEDAQPLIDSADPALLRTIVLINQGPMTDAVSQSIETYAQAGGGVVQLVSDSAVDPKRTSTAGPIDFNLEPLRVFEGPARAGLASLTWPGVSNRPIDERAQVILMDEQERVIVAEMPRGRGRLIAINAALHDAPGGLLAEPAFVVLFNELCRYASPGPAMPAPARPGDRIPLALRSAEAIVGADGQVFDGAEFGRPGPYRATDQAGGVIDMIYAALDPAESDVRPPTPWSSQGAIPGDSDKGATTAMVDPAAALIRQTPIELWPYLIFMVLGLVAAESLLLRHYAGPRSADQRGGAA